jgi:hypothetical protein
MRESLLHARGMMKLSARPRVAVLPSHGKTDGASRLRAYMIADYLQSNGWHATVMPPQLGLSARRRVLRMQRPEVLLMQQARHPLNRPELYHPIPCVFDIDDADWLDPKLTEIVTNCCRSSSAVVAGSRWIAQWCGRLNSRTRIVWTGTPLSKEPHFAPPAARQPVIAWAQSYPAGYPHEARFVQEVLMALARERSFTYMIYGLRAEDEAFSEQHLSPLNALGVKTIAHRFMPYDRLLQSLQTVAIGLQPICTDNPFSLGKSFGKILAYLSAGAAIVASDAVDHGLFFRQGTNGMLASSANQPGNSGSEENIESWLTAIRQLLDSSQKRESMVCAAYQDAVQRLSLEAAGQGIDAALRSVREDHT